MNLSYRITINFDEIAILLGRDDVVFCEFKFNTISIIQKHNTELEATIKDLAYHPYPSLLHQNHPKPLYTNLVAPNNDNTPIKIRLIKSINQSVLL
jgi:hypothetical protein